MISSPLLKGCQFSLCSELISMFVKLVSRKWCLIPHFEPQATGSRAEMVGVFLAHVCGLVSDWLGNQVQKPIFWKSMFHRSRLQNVPLLRILDQDKWRGTLYQPHGWSCGFILAVSPGATEDTLNSLGGDGEGGRCSQAPQDSNIWECVKAMNTVEKSVSVWPCLSEQEWAASWLWNSILPCCGFRKERAPISLAVSLPALSMLYTGTDGNLQRPPRTCL